MFILWLLLLIGATVVVGQRVALPLFMALYLVFWGKYGWRLAVTYAAVGWLFLQLMFDKVVHVIWYPSLLLG